MTNTKTISFEPSNIYNMTFIGDSDLKVKWFCVKRTAKTVTFERYQSNESMTRRIKVWDNVEYILEGSYSMAPSIQADKCVG